MPGTAKDSSFPTVAIFVDVRWKRRPDDPTQADARPLMGTGVLQGVVFTFQVENADLAPFDPDDLSAARRYLANRGDNVAGH